VPRSARLQVRQGLPTGQAVATTAGELDARWVIHTVGPVHSATEDRSHLLASCYRASLRVADDLGARTVAFPAISTGVYHWPLPDAARIAVTTVRATDTRVEEVVFVLFDERAHAAFAAAVG
jgi:O-acetyl-ADP-ribose deacetylase (regulator of RNase III)